MYSSTYHRRPHLCTHVWRSSAHLDSTHLSASHHLTGSHVTKITESSRTPSLWSHGASDRRGVTSHEKRVRLSFIQNTYSSSSSSSSHSRHASKRIRDHAPSHTSLLHHHLLLLLDLLLLHLLLLFFLLLLFLLKAYILKRLIKISQSRISVTGSR